MTAVAIISARATEILAALRCPRCGKPRHLDKHGHPAMRCHYCQYDWPTED